MTATARLILVVAVSLTALGAASLSASPAWAEEECLAAPNKQAPPGSRWYYRTDPVKQSKCWHLRTEGQAIQNPAAKEEPETEITPKQPAVTSSKTAPAQPEPESLELRPGQTPPAASGDAPARVGIQNRAQPNRRAGAGQVASPDPALSAAVGKVAWPDPPPVGGGNVAWPDPPSPAGVDTVAWPDPPSRAGGVTQGVTAEKPPEERASQTQQMPATAAKSDKAAGNDARVGTQVAGLTKAADAQSETPAWMLLAFAIGLVIAGILVRQIVKVRLARRSERREPVWLNSMTSERTRPRVMSQERDLAPDQVDADGLDDEVKEALRKLVRVLEQHMA